LSGKNRKVIKSVKRAKKKKLGEGGTRTYATAMSLHKKEIPAGLKGRIAYPGGPPVRTTVIKIGFPITKIAQIFLVTPGYCGQLFY
jgi:hypothetical protein